MQGGLRESSLLTHGVTYKSRRRLSTWRDSAVHDANEEWRPQLDAIRIEEPALASGSWLDVLDCDSDGLVSRGDLIAALWRFGAEPTPAEFEALLGEVQEMWRFQGEGGAEAVQRCAQVARRLVDTFGEPRFEVAKRIRDWEASVLAERDFTFGELWRRRLLAYALGLGGELWNPAEASAAFREGRTDLVSEAKIFRILGRVFGVFWLACLAGLAWWMSLGHPEDGIFAANMTTNGTTAGSVGGGVVGLTDVMVPLLITGAVCIVIHPYREARTYCREQGLVQELFGQKFHFGLQYAPMQLQDGTVVSTAAFMRCFVLSKSEWTRFWEPRPLRFKKKLTAAQSTHDNSDVQEAAAVPNDGRGNEADEKGKATEGTPTPTTTTRGRRPSQVAADEHAKAVQGSDSNTQSKGGAVAAALGSLSLAFIPGALRLHFTGSFAPTAQRASEGTLAAYALGLTLVIAVLVVLLVVRTDTVGAAAFSRKHSARIAFLSGTGGDQGGRRGLGASIGARLFDPFGSQANIVAFKLLRDCVLEGHNLAGRQWFDVTSATLLVSNTTLAAAFLLFALIRESDSLLTVFNLSLLVWILVTFGMLLDGLRAKADLNKSSHEQFCALLTNEILRLLTFRKDLLGDGRENEKGASASRHATDRIELLRGLIEQVRSDEASFAKLLGASVTYQRIFRLVGGILGALVSGLFKLAFAK